MQNNAGRSIDFQPRPVAPAVYVDRLYVLLLDARPGQLDAAAQDFVELPHVDGTGVIYVPRVEELPCKAAARQS